MYIEHLTEIWIWTINMWVLYLPNLRLHFDTAVWFIYQQSHWMSCKSIWDIRIICGNFEARNRCWQNMEQLGWHLHLHLDHMPWKLSPTSLQVVFNLHFLSATPLSPSTWMYFQVHLNFLSSFTFTFPSLVNYPLSFSLCPPSWHCPLFIVGLPVAKAITLKGQRAY